MFNLIPIILYLTANTLVKEKVDDLALVNVSVKAFDVIERLHRFLFLKGVSSLDDSPLDP